MSIKSILTIALTFLIMNTSIPTVWACSMCYKDPTSPMTIGLKSAVVVMLGALFIVFGAFIKFIFGIRKRSQLLEQQR